MMTKNFPNLVLFGSPGAGKGTLCEKLEEKYNYRTISTGNTLRTIANQNTFLSNEIKAIMANGYLIPDEIIFAIIKEKIEECTHYKQAYILDGFPQNLRQYEFLKSFFLTEQERNKITFVHLNTDYEKAIDRMSTRLSCPYCHKIYNERTSPPTIHNLCDVCNSILERRTTDSRDKAILRLEIFKKTTLPILKYIKKDFPLISLVDPTTHIIEDLIFRR